MTLIDPFSEVSTSRRAFMVRVQRTLFTIGTAGVIGAVLHRFSPNVEAAASATTNTGNNTQVGGTGVCDCVHPNGTQPCHCVS